MPNTSFFLEKENWRCVLWVCVRAAEGVEKAVNLLSRRVFVAARNGSSSFGSTDNCCSTCDGLFSNIVVTINWAVMSRPAVDLTAGCCSKLCSVNVITNAILSAVRGGDSCQREKSNNWFASKCTAAALPLCRGSSTWSAGSPLVTLENQLL